MMMCYAEAGLEHDAPSAADRTAGGDGWVPQAVPAARAALQAAASQGATIGAVPGASLRAHVYGAAHLLVHGQRFLRSPNCCDTLRFVAHEALLSLVLRA